MYLLHRYANDIDITADCIYIETCKWSTCLQMLKLTDRISTARNTIASVRLSVRLFPLLISEPSEL